METPGGTQDPGGVVFYSNQVQIQIRIKIKIQIQMKYKDKLEHLEGPRWGCFYSNQVWSTGGDPSRPANKHCLWELLRDMSSENKY